MFTKVIKAFHEILARSGVDPAYGRRLHTMLRELGPVDVHAEGHIQISAGGSPVWRLHQANIELLRDRLVGLGLLDDHEMERLAPDRIARVLIQLPPDDLRARPATGLVSCPDSKRTREMSKPIEQLQQPGIDASALLL